MCAGCRTRRAIDCGLTRTVEGRAWVWGWFVASSWVSVDAGVLSTCWTSMEPWNEVACKLGRFDACNIGEAGFHWTSEPYESVMSVSEFQMSCQQLS